MIKFLTYIVAISAFINRVASEQEVFSRVVVGISEETLYNIQFNIPSAIANRVLQFMQGFDTVHQNLATLANIENPQEILLLSKNHSHIIIFDWFDKFIYRVCNRTIYNPIRLFRHVSMHTIEGPKKFAAGLRLSEEDLRRFKGSGCERNDDDSVSIKAFFVNIDALLLGLRSKIPRFESLYSEKNKFFTYVPVPVPLSIYQMRPKPDRVLKIFFDWDDRSIGHVYDAKIILTAIEIFRSNRENWKGSHYSEGLEVITTGTLPDAIRGITTVSVIGLLSPSAFLSLLSSCHAYATPIRSSYENPVVESQMGGAYIISTPGTVKDELFSPLSTIMSDNSTFLADKLYSVLLSGSIDQLFRREAIHRWTRNQHAPIVAACSYIHYISDSKPDLSSTIAAKCMGVKSYLFS